MNNSSVQKEQKWNYVPDQKLIATYLADFQKKDTELSHTWVYKIDSLPDSWYIESPYGPFASNELLIGIHSGADCQEVIRALYIVKASGNISLYSNEMCGVSGKVVFSPETPYEQFLAIIQFLESKNELFDYVALNLIFTPN